MTTTRINPPLHLRACSSNLFTRQFETNTVGGAPTNPSFVTPHTPNSMRMTMEFWATGQTNWLIIEPQQEEEEEENSPQLLVFVFQLVSLVSFELLRFLPRN